MEKEIVVFLLQKHIAGTLTEAEKNELTEFISRRQNKEIITATLEELLSKEQPLPEFEENRFMPLLAGILKADAIEDKEEEADSTIGKRPVFSRKTIMLVLLAVIILGATGVYFYYFNPFASKTIHYNNDSILNEVRPGGNIAVLTLSDGSTMVLDSADTGFVAQQGNAKIIKSANGELTYTVSGEPNSTSLFNTITTPHGGQYQVVLSDGSRVKLNSFSSITYPTTFVGKERRVTITGEAYFEIAKNVKMPFRVKAYDMEVEVMSTEFNINAYTEEPAIKTTLMKGILKLTNNEMMLMLHASQQGQFDKEGKFSVGKNIDTNEVIAWKNGYFQFNNTDVKTVMRQIGRWYNVDIVYEKGTHADQEVFGEIRRNVNLSEIIKMLKKNSINCRLDGRSLIVMPFSENN